MAANSAQQWKGTAEPKGSVGGGAQKQRTLMVDGRPWQPLDRQWEFFCAGLTALDQKNSLNQVFIRRTALLKMLSSDLLVGNSRAPKLRLP